jgi:hypothetical protein
VKSSEGSQNIFQPIYALRALEVGFYLRLIGEPRLKTIAFNDLTVHNPAIDINGRPSLNRKNFVGEALE